MSEADHHRSILEAALILDSMCEVEKRVGAGEGTWQRSIFLDFSFQYRESRYAKNPDIG